jgi:hypothetical protein
MFTAGFRARHAGVAAELDGTVVGDDLFDEPPHATKTNPDPTTATSTVYQRQDIPAPSLGRGHLPMT